MLLYVILLSTARLVTPLIGFDCGSQHLNITTISLLDVGDCNLNIKEPSTTDVYIQLHCGMHSHVSVVHNGRADYVREVGYTQCLALFQGGTISVGAENLLHGIGANRTTTHSITLAGRIFNDGSCKGVQFSDPYGTICALKEGFCVDSDDGYSYWKPIPVTTCDFHQYSVLYQGPATKQKNNPYAATPCSKRNTRSCSY